MFYIKQLVATWTEPLAFVMLVALVGVTCRLIGWRKVGSAAIALAILAAYASSIDVVSAALLRPLESQYPAFLDDAALPNVGYVVVLGNDYYADEQLPTSANVAPEGIVRVVEGVRLQRRLPQARLVFTGGLIPNRGQVSLGNARLARSLGVAEESIVVLANALDTAGEARDVRQLLGDSPFLLVTSASHMPRAMRLMLGAGTHPVAAPTGHATENHPEGSLSWRSFVPNSGNVVSVNAALHEYLGLTAIALSLGEPATLD